jgi:hypothetical protein
MPIDKIRRRPSSETQPQNAPGEWKWFNFLGDFLKYSSDTASTTRSVLTDNAEIITAAETLTALKSGQTFFLNTAGGFTVTLPAPALGLRYRFIVKTAPTTSYVIASHAADLIIGQAHSSTGGNADSETTAGASEMNFAANVALAGDWAEFISDGTYWYAQAFSDADAGVTFTN